MYFRCTLKKLEISTHILWRRQWHPTLGWKIPWTEEPGRLQSMGSLRVRHDWETSLSLFTFHSCALEREMATHSSVLAWRIPGTGEPGGLPSMGSHRVGHDWSDLVRVEYSKICNCIGVPASNSAITWDQETFWKKFISKTKFCTWAWLKSGILVCGTQNLF